MRRGVELGGRRKQHGLGKRSSWAKIVIWLTFARPQNYRTNGIMMNYLNDIPSPFDGQFGRIQAYKALLRWFKAERYDENGLGRVPISKQGNQLLGP